MTTCRERDVESRIKLRVNSSGRGKGTGDARGDGSQRTAWRTADSRVWKMSNDEKKRLREEWKKNVEYGKRWLGGDRLLGIQADVR